MIVHRIVWTWAGLALLGALLSGARAATAEELQKRFQERYPKLRAEKSAGRLGENAEGYIEPVKMEYLKEEGLLAFLKAENADRTALYTLLADKEKILPEAVAQRNADRNFQRARPGDYLKARDGVWTRKK